jgi:hypothetical protein
MAKASGSKNGVHYSIRSVSEGVVKQYAGAIKRGEWKLTGGAITFDSEGRLQDGQHRLAAVVEADRAIQTFVVRNLEPAAQEAVDTGLKRNFAHVLQLRGYKAATHIAAAARALYAYRHTRRFDAKSLGGFTSTPAPTNQQLLNLVQRHPGLIESAKFVHKLRKNSPMKFPAGVAAFHYVIEERYDDDTATTFLERLCDMSYGGSGKLDPIVQLRKRLIEGQATGVSGNMATRVKMALMVKAFNAWVQGSEPHNLRWRAGGAKPEPFPEIVSPEAAGQ